MQIDPREAAVILRIFQEFADGQAISRLVRRLNEGARADRDPG